MMRMLISSYLSVGLLLCLSGLSLASPLQAEEIAAAPAEKMASTTPTATAITANGTAQQQENQPQPTGQKEAVQIDIKQLSQAFGHFIGRNLNTPAVPFDLESLIQGIRDGATGKPAPMSDGEYETMLAALQERTFLQLSEQNLKKAETFLAENARSPNVIELVAGKLQYEVLSQGNGVVVKEHSTPQIYYTGRFLDGTIFGSTEGTEAPIAIPLDQTIPGFSKGLLGMKEGEKRRLYVHPELAYGTAGQLPPNELLIFEVEIFKADGAAVADSDSLEEDDEFDASLSKLSN